MRSSSKLGEALPLLALILVTACGDRDSRWDDYLEMEGPIVVEEQLAWLNPAMGLVITVRPGTASPACQPVLEQARGLAPAANALVLLGDEGRRTFLQRLSLAGDSIRIPLAADFDKLAVGANGRAAVAYHDLERSQRPGGPVARNLNEVAFIDLQAAKATQLLLQTGAAAPTEVLFSGDGELAAILFERALALVEVRRPEDVVLVPLKLPGGQPLRILESILEPGGSFLYLRTAELDEVLAISIDREGSRLAASINFLGPGGATELVDIALPAGEGLDRKIAALYQDRATLFDADGDTSRDVSIFFSGSPTRISVLGDGLLLLHGTPAQRNESTTLAAWDPLSGRIAQDRLEGPLVGSPIVAGATIFFPHSVGGRPALSAATVTREEIRLRLRLQPIGLSGFPADLTADGTSGKLFAGVNIPRKKSGAAPRPGSDDGTTGAILSLRADDLAIEGLTLDEVIVELGSVGDHLFALHPSNLGDVTFVPKGELVRSAAVRFENLSTTGLIGCER